MVGETVLIHWHMSPYGPFWLQGGLGKNPMVGWEVGCTIILTTWKVKWEQESSSAIQGDLMIGAVEWECTVTWNFRTTCQEAESLKDRRVMRVFTVSQQLPFKKGHLLCLCDKYWVNAVARNPDHWIFAQSPTYVAVWSILIERFLGGNTRW